MMSLATNTENKEEIDEDTTC